MKKIVLLLFCILCTACTNTNLNANLDNLFSSVDTINYYNTNNNLKYYSYYLPSDMGEEEIDSDSLTIKYNESEIIMNLNISDIINSKYYSDYLLEDDGFYNSEYLVYENNGTYTLSDESEKQYLFKLYNYGDYYALYLKTSDMIFYGKVAYGDIKETARHLMIISKSLVVDSDLVISTFSKKDTIDYNKKQIDLFNSSMPTSGSLSDMLTDEAIIGDTPANELVDENQTNTENENSQVDETTDNNEEVGTEE